MNRSATALKRFFRSHEFKRALLMAGLMMLSAFLLIQLKQERYIVGVSLGIFLTSLCDLTGSFRHRTLAMFFSILLNSLLIIGVNIFWQHEVLLIFYIALGAFLVSFLSVFSNRASLVALSALLALVLGLIRQFEDYALLFHILSIIAGGSLYVFFSSFYHHVSRKSQRLQRLGELMTLTTNYFQEKINVTDKIPTSILDLQVEINQKQEELRNLIYTERQNSGQSNTRNRHLLILIELIDLMDLGSSNSHSLNTIKNQINISDNYLQVFENYAQSLVNRSYELAASLIDGQWIEDQMNFNRLHEDCEQVITDYVKLVGLPEARLVALQLRNYLEYLDNQRQSLQAIERLLSKVNRQRNIAPTSLDFKRFITSEDYNPALLTENVTLQSPIFRHALRLSIGLLVGYVLGHVFNVTNIYWILLTIVVILRPNYGLTVQRSRNRVAGTILGVIIAIILFLFPINQTFLLILLTISLILAVATLSANYMLAATFITLNVIFLFSLLSPDQWDVITYRLIDTIIGASVSVLVSYFIFPSWEINHIQDALKEAIESNQQLLDLMPTIQQDDLAEMPFRLVRKKAFIKSSELNASFQRFTQDPKNKQVHYPEYYQLVTLNQTLFSSLTSLSRYLRDHDLRAYKDQIQMACHSLFEQMDAVLALYNRQEKDHANKQYAVSHRAEKQLNEIWANLESRRNDQIEHGQIDITPELRQELQSVQLLRTEFSWIESLIENMHDEVQKILINPSSQLIDKS